MGDGPKPTKSILYFGPSPGQFEGLIDALSRVQGCQRSDRNGDEFQLECSTVCTIWRAEFDADRVFDVLARRFVNLVILDLRCPGDEACVERYSRRALNALDTLDQVEDPEERYGFHRILVLIAATPSETMDHAVLEMGSRGVRQLMRASPTTGLGERSDDVFAEELLERLAVLLAPSPHGSTALCAAGGGITGIYFEMGVLKCLDDCLDQEGGAANRFDMYFGISAGAVVMGLIAAGYSIDEFMAAVAGVSGGRLAPIDMSLFRLGHLDYPYLGRRAARAVSTGPATLWNSVRKRELPGPETVLFRYLDLVGPPFRADGFEQMLRGAFEAPGATNDFRQMARKLYVGVTDQDARQHVLFGDEANDEIPISEAIQASMSLNPAFTATLIRGRYYEDGAVTRTSNFAEAIRRGADLILVVDPFLPYVSHKAGFASRRGVFFNLEQNIRTMSYTRFENTRNWVLRRHPEVSSYAFLPANHLRRLLSISPFDHRPYLEIWRGAYLSTLSRLQRMRYRMAGDMGAHGLRLDLEKAEQVARQLEDKPEPDFEDFYPQRQVVMPRPPLSLPAGGGPGHGRGAAR